ncbi:hypothetical protein J2Y54_002819 [Sphingomonas sp. BE123]|uniref:hypothetical protein n=1 Tax=Sphingomonas sp. BE123 TaxID=2817842 RepID=UPI0028658244|nr:hypothetical protein [Sphingomonas sp. BE123]MDR6853299.1 hypothetical protein [Sphingomonas sp. BE123]
MVAYALVQRLTPNIALALAGVAGACAVVASLALPTALLEDLVLRSGIAAFVPAAEPPLGLTARLCLGLFSGGLVTLIAWMGLSAVMAWRESRDTDEPEGERRPTVRRADAHPDARPREPLRARDLEPAGTVTLADALAPLDLADPLPDEPAIAMGPPSEGRPLHAALPEVQDLPADLDQPLAAFDPAAIPAVPMAPPPPVRPLRRRTPRMPIYDAGERFETFELTPPVRPVPQVQAEPSPAAPQPIATPQTEASVQALLERLERGLGKFAPPPPEPEPDPRRKLEDALSELRRMAMRA